MLKTEKGSVQILLIVFIAISLATGFFAYVLYMAKEQEVQKVYSLEKEKAKLEESQKKLQGRILDQDEQLEELRAELNDTAENLLVAERAYTEAKTARETLRSNLDEKETLIESTKSEMERNYADKAAELKEEQEQKNTDADKFQNQLDTMEKQLAEAKRLKEESEKNIKGKISLLETKVSQLKRRLKILGSSSNKEENFSNPLADGTVLKTDAENTYVIIDLNRADGLAPGTPFEVLHSNSSEKNPLIKGRIVVKEVREKVSFCIVEKVNNVLNPIVPGDLVGNAIFARSQDRKKTFVLDGTFESHTEEEITAQIKEYGGKVENDLTLYTDFLVVGKNPTKQKQAMDFGVQLMREDQLYRFIK